MNLLDAQSNLIPSFSMPITTLEMRCLFLTVEYTPHPSLRPLPGRLSRCRKAKGQLAEAIAVYRQALAIQPNNAHILNNLGNALKDSVRTGAPPPH